MNNRAIELEKREKNYKIYKIALRSMTRVFKSKLHDHFNCWKRKTQLMRAQFAKYKVGAKNGVPMFNDLGKMDEPSFLDMSGALNTSEFKTYGNTMEPRHSIVSTQEKRAEAIKLGLKALKAII